MSYPPRPDFTWLHDPRRTELLGHIVYQRTSGDNIRITNDWAARNLVRVFIPQLERVSQATSIYAHRLAADQLRRLWQAWEAAGLLDRVLTWDGGFVPRTIRGKPAVLSNHAYGTAFDINARWNPFYKRPAPRGETGCVFDLVPLANAHGFWWGGHWNYDGLGACDGMHFEWAVPR